MSQESKQRERDRRQLEQDLQADEYQELLRDLQINSGFPADYHSWAEVVATMRSGTSNDPRKDIVLRPLLEAHAETDDPRLWSILLVIFWPGLETIHFRRRCWDSDESERWQNLVWTFFQVVRRMDVKRRPDRLVQKIINDTVHRLYDEYRRVWKRQDMEVSVTSGRLDALTGGQEWIGLVELEFVESRETEIDRLRKHVEAGDISEIDFHLIVETRLFGRSLRRCAADLGISYEAAKKRRQRAEAAVGRFSHFD